MTRPFVDFTQPTPHHTPTPQNPFESHLRAFTPYSAQTTTIFLKTPPSLFKALVIFYFYFYYTPFELFSPDAAVTSHPKVGGINVGNQVGGA
jgi:hypothetical protein